MMSYFKTVNLNPTAAAVVRANDKREQDKQAQERLDHWARLRRDYPAIERATK
tara:strand:- start:149 stop:307 length:159 start_codon:yes stop_codon:yes gene_type:complete